MTDKELADYIINKELARQYRLDRVNDLLIEVLQ